MHQHGSILPLLIGWMAYVVRKNPKAPLHNCSSSTSSPSKTLSNVLLYSFKISLPIFLFSFHLMFPFSPSKVIYFLHSIHFHCHFFWRIKEKYYAIFSYTYVFTFLHFIILCILLSTSTVRKHDRRAALQQNNDILQYPKITEIKNEVLLPFFFFFLSSSLPSVKSIYYHCDVLFWLIITICLGILQQAPFLVSEFFIFAWDDFFCLGYFYAVKKKEGNFVYVVDDVLSSLFFAMKRQWSLNHITKKACIHASE